ncbi:hypothetical protein [Spirosoma areae]
MDQYLDKSDLITGLLIAFISFVAGLLWTKRKEASKQRTEQMAKLETFLEHLNEAKRIFEAQIVRRDQLYQTFVKPVSPGVIVRGYNEEFESQFDGMNKDQREKFQLIRGQTETAMYTINKHLQDDLRQLTIDKLNLRDTSMAKEVRSDVEVLWEHLLDWFAKYEGVFKLNPKQCLVYVNDEKRHGREFPQGIENRVRQLIAENK